MDTACTRRPTGCAGGGTLFCCAVDGARWTGRGEECTVRPPSAQCGACDARRTARRPCIAGSAFFSGLQAALLGCIGPPNGATVTSYADIVMGYNFYPNRIGRTVADGKGNVYVVAHRGDCNQSQGLEWLTATDAQHFRANSGDELKNWYANGESCADTVAITLAPDGKHLYVQPRSSNNERHLVEFDVTDLSKPSRRLSEMHTDNRGHWLAVTPH